MLRNPRGILYTGIAKDTERRLGEHNNGRGAKSTRGKGPWVLSHREGPFSHGDALRREMEIKALSKQQKDALIESS